MKKYYRLTIDYTDDLEDPESLPDMLEDERVECVWLDNGSFTVLLPEEVAKYVEESGILGVA